MILSYSCASSSALQSPCVLGYAVNILFSRDMVESYKSRTESYKFRTNVIPRLLTTLHILHSGTIVEGASASADHTGGTLAIARFPIGAPEFSARHAFTVAICQNKSITVQKDNRVLARCRQTRDATTSKQGARVGDLREIEKQTPRRLHPRSPAPPRSILHDCPEQKM